MLQKVRDVVKDLGFEPDSEEDSGNPTWHILLCIKDDFEQCVINHGGLCMIALMRHMDCLTSEGILTKLNSMAEHDESFERTFIEVLETLEKFERSLQTLPSPPLPKEQEAWKDQILYEVDEVEEKVKDEGESSPGKRARNE